MENTEDMQAVTDLGHDASEKRDAWARRGRTEAYVSEIGPYAVERDAEIVGRLLGRGPGVLLDLPCGTGRYLATETERGFTVVGADYSPTMMGVARQVEGASLVRADVFRPPFGRERFDVVLVSRLLFHYENGERIIASLLPSLKPGGRMIFDTLNPFSTRWLASSVVDPIRRDPARTLYFEAPGAFEKKLAELGLTVLETAGAYVLPTRSYRLLPRFVTAAVHRLESVVPERLRVLTFWHVQKD